MNDATTTSRVRLPLALALTAAAFWAYYSSQGRLYSSRPEEPVSLFLLAVAYGQIALPLLLMTFIPALLVKLQAASRPRATRIFFLIPAFSACAALAGVNEELIPPRLFCGTVTLIILFAALSAGSAFLALAEKLSVKIIPFSPLERLAIAAGLGLLMLSFATFAAGVAGMITQGAAAGILAVCVAAGGRRAWRLLREAVSEFFAQCEESPALGWCALGFVLAGLVFLLPGAFFPPLDYDVLEYHIQLPREYFDLGRIRVLPHNAFSGFPLGMEMLTLLAFMLTGGYHGIPLAASHGIWVAKLLNLAFLPLLLLAIFLCVRRLAGAKSGTTGGMLACALALACLQTDALAMKLYVELGLGAYLLLALLCLAIAWTEKRENFLALCALAGIFSGAAACCKYTGLIFVGGPLFLLALLTPVEGIPRSARVKGALALGAVCWLTLSPWLLRNFAEAGNPFYPLWNQAFSVENWSAQQEQRFYQAHHATGFGAVEMAKQFVRVGLGGDWPGWASGSALSVLGLVFLPGLLCLRRTDGRGKILAVLGWYVGGFLLWFFLTHRLERFYHQVFLLGCVLSGCGFAFLRKEASQSGGVARGLGLAAGVWALLFCVVSQAAFVGTNWFGDQNGITPVKTLLGVEPPEKMLAAYYMPWSLREKMLNALPPDAKVLLLGSADPFWLPSNVEYAMVFSNHPLWELLQKSKSAEDVHQSLRARGITHIYINWSELARLHSTYFEAYRLDRDGQARLRELLTSCGYENLSPPWPFGRVRDSRPYVKKLADNLPLLFPGGLPAGRYAQAPYELFPLPAETKK
jgi:hypothetical protein